MVVNVLDARWWRVSLGGDYPYQMWPDADRLVFAVELDVQPVSAVSATVADHDGLLV
jgi:hypothetical protein